MKFEHISQTGEAAITPPPPPATPSHRILVVEDDATIRQPVADALVRFGYQVDAAEDGAVAWEALQAKNYDLLITDNSMPKVTGVDLLKKLHAANIALPVIMATATVPQEEFTRFPWLRPAATLLKPYTFEQLRDAVNKLLCGSLVIVALHLCLAGAVHRPGPVSETVTATLSFSR